MVRGLGKMIAAVLLLSATVAAAEDGSAAWLRYARVTADGYRGVPSRIVVVDNSAVERSAADELRRGLSAMLGREFTVAPDPAGARAENAIVLEAAPHSAASARTLDEFALDFAAAHARLTISGNTPRAVLYGTFRLLALVGAERSIPAHVEERAAAAIRWTDEWDNMDGSVERGYAGRSIFFEGGHVRADLGRVAAYARLLASVGINGCNVTNVNADLDVLSTAHIQEFKRLADAMRPWGVRLALSVDMTSPQTMGGMSSFDPLDPQVEDWWRRKVDEIYAAIPDFAGFTVKADSEGRKGPSFYGRSPADAANALAHALEPHGGVVLYRGFVYDNHLNWNDPKADRARAGVDNFARYDGQFAPNVVVQIKEGPIDFQAREAVSPLFAALSHSNQAIELQTAQEYTGQQRDMVWLPSMWKWVFDTDLRAGGRSTPVSRIVEGRAFPLPDGSARLGGFVSVTNVGLEPNWLHHPMAMANLYGFGRLAWNPDLKLDAVIDEWTRLTWGNDAKVDAAIDTMQLESWRVYEGYTGPNGMGTLTNILGYHFGPGIESAERNGWGQWFRADAHGIGMERGAAGTGFIEQYPPQLAAQYEPLATCPDELLLFFHHVPYDYKLHSGKTMVQAIYDDHYASAEEAASYERRWMELKGKVDAERYEQVLALFRFQAGHAALWRDAVNDWFAHTSGIADAQGRVGHHSGRIEAEAMQAEGYQMREIVPWETASGGRAMECRVAAGCTLATTLAQPQGVYALTVAYYDVWRGASQFELELNGRAIAAWKADAQLPPAQFDPLPDGQTATRFTVHGVALKPGDRLVLRGTPDLRPELIVKSGEGTHLWVRDYREYATVDFMEAVPEDATGLE
jgi:alpha-glucuronidase